MLANISFKLKYCMLFNFPRYIQVQPTIINKINSGAVWKNKA